MAAFAYDAINAQGLEISGVIHAPDVSAAREQLQTRGLLPHSLAERSAAGERGAASAFKKVKPKSLQIFARQFATMIGAGVSVVAGARDARGADRRQVPRRGDRRRPLRRRGRRHPLEGAGAASEGLQPPVRRDGRGRRVVGNARHRARPRGDADREGDADQAARQGSDGLSRPSSSRSRRSCSRSCSCSSSPSS